MNRRNRVGQTVVGAVVFGAVLMAAPLGAQGLSGDDGARPVSLREAIELAAKNSPAAVSARGLDRNAAAARRQAIARAVLGDLRQIAHPNSYFSWLPLPEDARAVLAAAGKFSSLPEGFFLMKQGDPQDLLCILISGKLSATAHSDASVVELGMIMPGESVGEMNVIDPKQASADVKAVLTSRVWSISKEALDRYLEENPIHGVQLLRSISTQLCRRSRRNSDKMLRQLETASTIYEWLD